MLTAFPQSESRRIQLPPALGPEELGSWDAIGPRQRIRLASATDSQAADVDGYFPVQAVYLVGKPVRSAGCGGSTVILNNGLSRCAIWLIGIDPDTQILAPLTIEWEIKASAGCVSEVVLTGTTQLNAQASPGATIPGALIAEVQTPLCNQIEFWARVATGGDEGSAIPLEVSLEFLVDRIGDGLIAYLGRSSGGTGLPVVNAKGP